MHRVLVVYGTRPEAIKVAPLLALSKSQSVELIPVVTGQHREMLDQVNRLFGIIPRYDLNIFKHGQSLDEIASQTLRSVSHVLRREEPDGVLVQGDTTTALASALAAFYRSIPVFHLEAGLRTLDKRNPFPEELNRRLISQMADLHLAATNSNRENLLLDNVLPSQIIVTGNTVIDSLQWASRQETPFADAAVAAAYESAKKIILVTAHRRESWGASLRTVGRAIRHLARREDVVVILSMHKNPAVREALLAKVENLPSSLIPVEPLDYGSFARLLARCDVVLTDSGGLQEEAPSLGKPVLVMRENTERPEAVEAGTARLVGTDFDAIVSETERLLDDPAHYSAMARALNPFGDGRASSRVIEAMESFFSGINSASML